MKLQLGVLFYEEIKKGRLFIQPSITYSDNSEPLGSNTETFIWDGTD